MAATKSKDWKLGDVVLLKRGMIGVIKYIGTLTGQPGQYLGIKLGEGSGDTDGTFRAVRYFECTPGKGMFVPPEDVKKVITAEMLLEKVVALSKKIKLHRHDISKLQDELNLTKEQARQAAASMVQKPNPEKDLDHDQAIHTYLANEKKKKWYIGLEDLQTRFRKRKANEVAKIYEEYRSDLEKLPTQAGHGRIVYTVCASKKDNLLGSGSDDKTIRLWRRENSGTQAVAKCIAKVELRSCINSLAFSPNGRVLAAALDSGWVELYDLRTGKMKGALSGTSTSEVWTIGFSPDGQSLISGALDRAVRIWDTREQECRWALRGHDEWVNGVAVSNDGTTIISGSGDKTVRLWETRTMKCRATLRGHTDFVRSVCVTENSKYVVSASDDCQLRVWNMDKSVCSKVLPGHKKGIYCVAAGKGLTVASASRDATVKVWDIDSENAAPTQEFKGHRGDVNSCAFVQDGTYIVSGSDDKQVKIFPVLQ